MPLEDPYTIDVITRPVPGRLELVITDAGATTDPGKRLAKLERKLQGYVTYLSSEEFPVDNPGVAIGSVTILVVCKTPPTPAMAQAAAALSVPVRFERFDPDTQAPGSDTFMTRALAQKPPCWRALANRLSAVGEQVKRAMRR